jgi:hypothetical protein
MKQLKRLRTLLVAAGIGIALVAPPADAKVLPYQLGVVDAAYFTGRPVTVLMETHPQNVLPPKFRFEVRWAKVRVGQTLEKAVRNVGNGVLMRQVGEHDYRGYFKPKTAGLFVVYGRTGGPGSGAEGYPEPIPVIVR